MSKVEKLWTRIKNKEYRYLFKRIFPKGNPVLYGGIQLVFKLTDVEKFEEMYALVSRRCNHDVLVAQGDDLDQLYKKYPEKATRFQRRIAAGNTCYVARKDGEITGYLWALEARDYFNTNSLWRLRPATMDGFWGFDGYVEPEYRMRGLFVYLMGAAREDFIKRGYTTLYGETDDRNSQSLNTHLSAGYEILWDVFFVSVFGLKFYVARNPGTNERRYSFRYSLRPNDLTL